ELLDLVSFVRPTPQEEEARTQWLGRLQAAARSLWPSCHVEVFGSCATGLCLPTALVDVAVNGLPMTLRPTTALKMLAERLLQTKEISRLEIAQSATVPIMRLQQRTCRCPVRETASRLQRGLHETFTGGVGSFLLVNLVLSFLQRHPSATDPNMHAITSVGNLLFDFFCHYGTEFDYSTHGISVLHGGGLIDRAARGWRRLRVPAPRAPELGLRRRSKAHTV
ncbi:unnamed protein product, partial [Prorocentrum cordatum]